MKIESAFPLVNRNEVANEQWRNINWNWAAKQMRRLENSIAKAVKYHDFVQVATLSQNLGIKQINKIISSSESYSR